MDHVSVFLVELGLLFLGISLLGLLSRRLGLSPIPFILVAPSPSVRVERSH